MRPLSLWIGGVLLLLVAGWAVADESFQMTVVSTLRHDRLEVSIGMSLGMASLLVEDPADPEAARLDAGNFSVRREQLEKQAMELYDVSAGGVALVPERASARLLPSGTVECAVVYLQPAGWPLRFHARARSSLPSEATTDLVVRDQDEKLLGRKVLSPRNSANADFSVMPEPMATASPPPKPVPPREAPPLLVAKGERLPEFGVVLGVGLALAGLTALLVMRFLRKEPGR